MKINLSLRRKILIVILSLLYFFIIGVDFTSVSAILFVVLPALLLFVLVIFNYLKKKIINN